MLKYLAGRRPVHHFVSLLLWFYNQCLCLKCKGETLIQQLYYLESIPDILSSKDLLAIKWANCPKKLIETRFPG